MYLVLPTRVLVPGTVRTSTFEIGSLGHTTQSSICFFLLHKTNEHFQTCSLSSFYHPLHAKKKYFIFLCFFLCLNVHKKTFKVQRLFGWGIVTKIAVWTPFIIIISKLRCMYCTSRYCVKTLISSYISLSWKQKQKQKQKQLKEVYFISLSWKLVL